MLGFGSLLAFLLFFAIDQLGRGVAAVSAAACDLPPLHTTLTTAAAHPIMDCAICLNRIELHNEAFLYPCFHRYCFSCIQEWTRSQEKHKADEGSSNFTCPLCKTPYTHVIYDCIGSSYRLLATCGQPGRVQAMALTADQRRRRALYVTQHPAHAQQAQEAEQAQAAASRLPRPRTPTNQQTSTWITRELQAVLLEEDVELIAQHVVGVLQHLANKQQQSRSKGPGVSPMYGQQTGFVAGLSQAIAGFLNEHADQFAAELWAFLHSGLTVAAFDRLVFGCDDEDGGEGLGQDDLVTCDEWLDSQ